MLNDALHMMAGAVATAGLAVFLDLRAYHARQAAREHWRAMHAAWQKRRAAAQPMAWPDRRWQ